MPMLSLASAWRTAVRHRDQPSHNERSLDKNDRLVCHTKERVGQGRGVGNKQTHARSGEAPVREARSVAGGIRFLLRVGLRLGGGYGAADFSEVTAGRGRPFFGTARLRVPGGAQRFAEPAAQPSARGGTA